MNKIGKNSWGASLDCCEFSRRVCASKRNWAQNEHSWIVFVASREFPVPAVASEAPSVWRRGSELGEPLLVNIFVSCHRSVADTHSQHVFQHLVSLIFVVTRHPERTTIMRNHIFSLVDTPSLLLFLLFASTVRAVVTYLSTWVSTFGIHLKSQMDFPHFILTSFESQMDFWDSFQDADRTQILLFGNS